MTAYDNASDTLTYAEDWAYDIGSGGVFAQTVGSGSVTITITVGDGRAGLEMFCYDIGGTSGQVTVSQFVTSYPSTGTSLAVPAFTVQPSSFLVGFWSADNAVSPPTFYPGTSFTLTSGSPITGHDQNYIASEWGAAPEQSDTVATCPMTISIAAPWGGVCFAFAPASTPMPPVPEFPLGVMALMGIALPALFVIRGKFFR